MLLHVNKRAVLGAVLSVTLVFGASPLPAFGVTAAEKKAEVESVSNKLDAMNEELELAIDDYNKAQRAYDSATEKVNSCKKKIDEAQEKINTLQTHLGTRAVSMYRSGSMSYLDVLLGVGSFDDFATVWDTLNNLNADDADLVSDTKDAKAELDAAKKELDEQQAEAQEQYDSAKALKNGIESKTAEYQSIYDNLNAEYKQLVEKEREAREQAAAQAVQAYFPSSTTSSSSSSSSSSNGGSSSGGGNSSAVDRAMSLLGVPYAYGGASRSGIDCSGLVSYALTGSFGHAYVSQDFWSMPAVSNPQPGDVVACHAGHCGLYIGNGQMIEAPHSGASVRISAVRGKIVRP